MGESRRLGRDIVDSARALVAGIVWACVVPNYSGRDGTRQTRHWTVMGKSGRRIRIAGARASPGDDGGERAHRRAFSVAARTAVAVGGSGKGWGVAEVKDGV